MPGEEISYIVAFLFGFLTFLSPCLLPLIPSFVAYITGISFGDLKEIKTSEVRKKTLVHSLLFVLGFSLVFILLGLTATAVGKILFQYQKTIRVIGGILIILFGLHLSGVLRFDFLLKERRLPLTAKGATYVSSFLIGVTFAAAWTPCAGPILGSILLLAGTKASVAQGARLLTVYSLGIALPFLITGLTVNSFLAYFNKVKRFIGAVNIASGLLLVVVGFLVATNYLAVISERLLNIFAK